MVVVGGSSPSKRASSSASHSSPTKHSASQTQSLNPSLPRLPSIPSFSLSPTKSSSTSSFLKHRSSTTTSTTTTSTSTTKRPPPSLSRPPPTAEPDSDLFSSDDDEGDEEGDSDGRPVPVQRREFRATTTRSTSAVSLVKTAVKEEDEGEGQESLEDEEDSEDDSHERLGGEAKKENVVVCLRVRPSKSSLQHQSPIYNFSTSTSSLTLTDAHPTIFKRGAMAKNSHHNDEYEFRFDALHLSPTPTSTLYEKKIKPVVRAAMKGFNGTVFAYGQTASGKTHTMMGSKIEPGIIPLAVEELFKFIHEQNETRSFSLRVSFLEIYNEQFRDLLLPTTPSTTTTTTSSKKTTLEVHGDDGTVKGLVEKPVSIPQEVISLLEEGDMRRRTGATDWNERSSRSHCVFIVTIESISKDSSSGVARTSRLNLIDLAGSESATGQEERRKEGSFINKSLLTLGTVIGKLTDRNASTQHIPYRDSKLTRLLQPALSGNSRVAVVCTISPDVEQATETLSTLKFAKRVKMVVTKAERGVLVNDQVLLRQYQKEVELLQAQISMRENNLVSDDKLARERDSAMKRADELHDRNKKAEEALASKDLELARLRKELETTQSFILTGPSIEANARRASSQFGSFSSFSPSKSTSSAVGLGLGSSVGPGGSGGGKGRVVSAFEGKGMDRDVSGVKEAALELKLSEAQKQLESLSFKEEEISRLESKISQLERSNSLARIDVEKSLKASSDRKMQLQSVQRELDAARAEVVQGQKKGEELEKKERELKEVKERLEGVLKERDAVGEEESHELVRVRSELERVKEDVKRLEEDVTILTRQLLKANQLVETLSKEVKELEEKVKILEATLKDKEKLYLDSETKLRSLERKLDKRDDRIKDLEREIAIFTKQISNLTMSKSSGIKAAEDKANALTKERDSLLLSGKEASNRLVEMEELSKLHLEAHQLAEVQLVKEKDHAVAMVQEDLKRVGEELVQKEERIVHLQRLVEGYERADQQRKSYQAFQRAGPDSLKSKLAELQAKQMMTPTSSSSSSAAGSGGGGANSSIFSRSGTRNFSGGDSVGDLQVKNGELAARIIDLERELAVRTPHSSTGSDVDPKEVERLSEVVTLQKKTIEETTSTAEHWRLRCLASEKELERLRRGKSSVSGNENLPSPPRHHLSTLNLSTNREPSLSSISSLPRSSRDPLPTSRASRDLSLSLHSPSKSLSSWTSQLPPPLPASPRQKEKDRTRRRETIAKDMEKLGEGSGRVKRTREALTSPTSSPKPSGPLQRPLSREFNGSSRY